MQYKDFVKAKMAEMAGMNMMAKDKMKKIGEMWRASGHSSKPKGGQFVGAGVKSKSMAKKAPMAKRSSMASHMKLMERIPINIAMQLKKGM
jgi:hypothetical protein